MLIILIPSSIMLLILKSSEAQVKERLNGLSAMIVTMRAQIAADAPATAPRPAAGNPAEVKAAPSSSEVDCVFDWIVHGPCSVSCGDGLQVEVTNIQTATANGGALCPTEIQ